MNLLDSILVKSEKCICGICKYIDLKMRTVQAQPGAKQNLITQKCCFEFGYKLLWISFICLYLHESYAIISCFTWMLLRVIFKYLNSIIVRETLYIMLYVICLKICNSFRYLLTRFYRDGTKKWKITSWIEVQNQLSCIFHVFGNVTQIDLLQIQL